MRGLPRNLFYAQRWYGAMCSKSFHICTYALILAIHRLLPEIRPPCCGHWPASQQAHFPERPMLAKHFFQVSRRIIFFQIQLEVTDRSTERLLRSAAGCKDGHYIIEIVCNGLLSSSANWPAVMGSTGPLAGPPLPASSHTASPTCHATFLGRRYSPLIS